MTAPRTGAQRFFALLAVAGFASAAWLLVPFAIVLTVLAYGALSWLAILGLAEIYLADFGIGAD